MRGRGSEAELKKIRVIYAVIFCGLLAIEIGIAVFVHDAFVRPYIGDMLVTLLLCCMCRVALPDKVRLLPVFVFVFAAFVEIGQYFDVVALIGLTDNRFLSIALGRTFSWMDLVCYAIGCVAAFGLDEVIRRSNK